MPFSDPGEERYIDTSHIQGTRFAVIGLGQFGRALARRLAASDDVEVVAVDKDMDRVREIKEDVPQVVQLDATDPDALRSQSFAELDVAVVTIGSNFEAALLVAVELQQLGVKRVIARASTTAQRRILESVGITEIISPERQMGYHIGTLLTRHNVVDYLRLYDEHAVMEIRAPEEFVGKTLGELDLPDSYKVTLITIRRHKDAGDEDEQDEDASDGGEEADEQEGGDEEEAKREREVIGVPRAETVVKKGDTLLLFGHQDNLEDLLDAYK